MQKTRYIQIICCTVNFVFFVYPVICDDSCFILYRKDIISSPQVLLPSLERLENIMAVMRGQHSGLLLEMDRIVEEIARKLRPDPEEDFAAALFTLYQLVLSQELLPGDALSASGRDTLNTIRSKYFGLPIEDTVCNLYHVRNCCVQLFSCVLFRLFFIHAKQ